MALLFLVLPTVLVTYPFLDMITDYFDLLQIPNTMLLVLFAAGAGASFILHGLRIRFIILSVLAIGAVYIGRTALHEAYIAEFDSFYWESRYEIYSAVFLTAWFTGYGLLKHRYFPLAYGAFITVASLILKSNDPQGSFSSIIWSFFFVILYVLYISFIKEVLEAEKERRWAAVGVLLKRSAVFGAFALLLYWLSLQLLTVKTDELKEAISQKTSLQEEGLGENNMLKKGEGDEDFDLKDYAQLDKKLDQSQQLMFAAYIDNFLELGFGERIPNPLYMTAYHLNQYNVNEGKFEIDTNNQFLDLYQPDPSSIPLYFKDADSSYLEEEKGKKFGEVMTSEVYLASLSAKNYLAPSTSFSCQPITIDEEFQGQFHYAYKNQSYISSLNSAYLVYNTDDPSIQAIQKQRYQVLRNVRNYNGMDSAWMEYYTRVPEGALFDSIQVLAKEIAQGQTRPIDKVLALRDFFYSKDEYGNPRFEYNLLPGYDDVDKNIPNSEMLENFLFNTGKGYCTYFAGSSLFILRSLGIPARMTTGFMTVDRSHNNPGWYWFYGNQAHAWTQIYFPKYGWLDFDFTIGDQQENTEPPSTDGTPPIMPQKAKFAGRGVVISLDTTNQVMDVGFSRIMWDDDEVEVKDQLRINTSYKDAKIMENKQPSTIKNLELGDSVIVVSYDQQILKIRKRWKETAEKLMERTPNPFPASEVHFKKLTEEEKKQHEKEDESEVEEAVSGWVYVGLLAGLLLLALSWPYLYHRNLIAKINKASTDRTKAYAAYRHALFTLNQFGYPLKNQTAKEFALYQVDPKFGTAFAGFIDSYLKTKYSLEELDEQERSRIDQQHPDFYKAVWVNHSQKQRFLNFLRVDRALQFLLNIE